MGTLRRYVWEGLKIPFPIGGAKMGRFSSESTIKYDKKLGNKMGRVWLAAVHSTVIVTIRR